MQEHLDADVAIIGAGFGAIAAAEALLARGKTVVMTEQYAWIGGQVTNQGLCVLDEYHDPIGEGVGHSRRYGNFRNDLRDAYRDKYELSDFGHSQLHFNPGNTMNSAVAAEPSVALGVINRRFEAAISEGRLTIRTGMVPIAAERQGDRVTAVVCRPAEDILSMRRCHVTAEFFLAGDETGELYRLLNIPYRLGSDAQREFGEPHAGLESQRDRIQSFTFCFMVEYRPGEEHTIPEPDDYEHWKELHGPFYLGSPGARPDDPAAMFKARRGRNGFNIPPAFYYRSVVDRRNFAGPDAPFSRSVINVPSNDYYHQAFLEAPDEEAVLQRGRALSRAYLYWMQTEAPRDDGGFGYPELRLVTEETAAADGIAEAPYAREGRRLDACTIVREQDLSTACQHGARARHFADSVGLGCFLLDIHQRSGGGETISQMTRPYQIPLGSMVAPQLKNFAVANKCIGVTQIANGAYRLHNTEWAIGEAAGELAAFCLEREIHHPALDPTQLLVFQRRLLRAGVPLVWMEDVGFDTPGFEAVQTLALKGAWPLHPRHLRFHPHYSVARSRGVFEAAMDRLASDGADIDEFRELHGFSHNTRINDVCHRLVHKLDQDGWPEAVVCRDTGFFDASVYNELIPGPYDEDDMPGQLAAFETDDLSQNNGSMEYRSRGVRAAAKTALTMICVAVLAWLASPAGAEVILADSFSAGRSGRANNGPLRGTAVEYTVADAPATWFTNDPGDPHLTSSQVSVRGVHGVRCASVELPSTSFGGDKDKLILRIRARPEGSQWLQVGFYSEFGNSATPFNANQLGVRLHATGRWDLVAGNSSNDNARTIATGTDGFDAETMTVIRLEYVAQANAVSLFLDDKRVVGNRSLEAFTPTFTGVGMYFQGVEGLKFRAKAPRIDDLEVEMVSASKDS